MHFSEKGLIFTNRKEKRDTAKNMQRCGAASRGIFKGAYTEGFKDGFDDGVQCTYKSCYCAAILAARELFGFGTDRSMRLLKRMDDIVHQSFTADEITRKVGEELHIRFDFGDGIEPFKYEE